MRAENSVTLRLSYILFHSSVFCFIGMATPGFYILGAFFALCLLAWDRSHVGSPIRLFNSIESSGSASPLLLPVDLSILLFCENELGFAWDLDFAYCSI